MKVENVEAVAGTLEELWLSYNSIEKLVRPRVQYVPPHDSSRTGRARVWLFLAF